MFDATLSRLSLLVWRPMTVMLLLGVLVSGLWAAQAIVLARAVDELIGSDAAPATNVARLVLLLVGIVLVRAVVAWALDVVAQRAGLTITSTLRDRLFDAAARRGGAWVDRSRAASVESALTDGVQGLESYYARYLPQIAISLAVGLGVVAWIALIDPVVAIVLAAAHLAVPLLPRLWDRSVAAAGSTHWDEYRRTHADFLEAMQGMTTLVAAGASERWLERLRRRSGALLASTLAQMRASLVGTSLSSFAVGLGTTLAIAVALVRADHLGAVGLLTVLFLAGESFRPFAALAGLWHQSYVGFSAAGAIGELLDDPDTNTNTNTNRASRPASTIAAPLQGTDIAPHPPRVTFERVTFTYPGATRPALHDISLTVEPGEHLGVVGPSGAGKSTLVALAIGELLPDEGRVRIDGVDTRDLPADERRARFGIVRQRPHVFHGTLAYNLAIGLNPSPDAVSHSAALTGDEGARIRDAAGRAGLTETLDRLGLDAQAGEWGRALSGGQRQRLAIARALASGRGGIVLDEATASVERATERSIHATLRDDAHPCTVVSITHRPDSLAACDRVLSLRAGGIARVEVRSTTGPSGFARSRLESTDVEPEPGGRSCGTGTGTGSGGVETARAATDGART